MLNINYYCKEFIRFYKYLSHKNHDDHVKTITQLIYSSWDILKMLFCQYILNLQCIPISKHIYDIQYQMHFRVFKLRVNYKKGPSPYLHFYDEKTNNDVTELIMPYIGPNHDFHGISYTPKDFGITKLKVEYLNGNSYVFTADEIIK